MNGNDSMKTYWPKLSSDAYRYLSFKFWENHVAPTMWLYTYI